MLLCRCWTSCLAGAPSAPRTNPSSARWRAAQPPSTTSPTSDATKPSSMDASPGSPNRPPRSGEPFNFPCLTLTQMAAPLCPTPLCWTLDVADALCGVFTWTLARKWLCEVLAGASSAPLCCVVSVFFSANKVDQRFSVLLISSEGSSLTY